MKSFQTFLTEAVNDLKKVLGSYIAKRFNNNLTLMQEEFLDLFYQGVYDFIKEYLSDHDIDEISKEEVENSVKENLKEKIPSYDAKNYKVIDHLKLDNLLAIPPLSFPKYCFYQHKDNFIINRAKTNDAWYSKDTEHIILNLFSTLEDCGIQIDYEEDSNYIFKFIHSNLEDLLIASSNLFSKNPYEKITLNRSVILLNSKNLKRLPWCPAKLIGGFYCHDNELTSLKGCTKEVDTFNCSDNLLTSLEYGPEIVKDTFSCNSNSKLTSLKGIAKQIGGVLYCNKNPSLKSLRPLENSKVKVNVVYDKKNMTDQKEARQIVSLAIRNYT